MGAHPLAYLHMCDLLGPTWFDGNFRVLFLIKLSIHICRQLSGFQGIAHAAYLKYGTYPARLNVFLAHWHGCIRNSAFFSMKCCRRGSPTLTHTRFAKSTDFAQHIEHWALSPACALFTCVRHWHPYPLYLNCQISGSGPGAEALGGAPQTGAQWPTIDDRKCIDKQAGQPILRVSISALNGWLTQPDGSCKIN